MRPIAVVLCACTLLLSPSAKADADPWFGADKAKHFAVSGSLSLAGYSAAWAFDQPATTRWLSGATLSLGAGAAKELWDLSGHGDASWRDFAWDVIGAATGLLIASAIDAAWQSAHARPAYSAP